MRSWRQAGPASRVVDPTSVVLQFCGPSRVCVSVSACLASIVVVVVVVVVGVVTAMVVVIVSNHHHPRQRQRRGAVAGQRHAVDP